MRDKPQPEGSRDTPADLAVVEAVAAHAGVNPKQLEPPLYEAVDPDALETVLSGDGGLSVTVAFEYAGYDVVARSDGSLVVE